MPIVIPTVQEILAEHGVDVTAPALPLASGWALLPDGTEVFAQQTDRGGPQFAPPANRRASLEGAARYHKLFANLARQTFEKIKQAELGHGTYSWQPQDSAIFGEPPADGHAALVKLRELFVLHQGKARQVEAELAALPEVVAERRREKERLDFIERQRRQREAESQAHSARIQAITLPADDEVGEPKKATPQLPAPATAVTPGILADASIRPLRPPAAARHPANEELARSLARVAELEAKLGKGKKEAPNAHA